MNGIPIKLDYSKTINEQLGTFNYYRNRYACYELELMRDRQQIDQLTNNWNELEEFIETEKTRLAKECSHTYEDSLGKTRYVNEDIFNELNNILDKMKEIKEGKNDKD